LQEVDVTRNPRIPEAEINGIYLNLAKAFSRRMLGDVPVLIAAPASRTRLAYDPAGRHPSTSLCGSLPDCSPFSC
jgi:hypothetical protein